MKNGYDCLPSRVLNSRFLSMGLLIRVAYGVLGCESGNKRFHLEKIQEIPLQLGQGQVACNIFDLALDDRGVFYLADKSCHTVWIVDDNGRELVRIGGAGQHGPGELSAPTGVAVSGDTLMVLEAGNHRVSVFTRSGEYLYSFTLQEAVPPSGIEIGPNDTLIVSESLGLRNFDFYTMSGRLVSSNTGKPISPVLAPVSLAGGHMSLTDDGFILYCTPFLGLHL